MSEEKSVATGHTGHKEEARGGGQHHHHYYYFYPADAAPPIPQPPAPPTPRQWAVESCGAAAAPAPGQGCGQPGHSEAGGSHHHPHSHPHLGENTFVRGLLVGGAVGLVLTNETVQKTLIRTAVRLWTVAQGGVEEVKERFRDAEAEIKASVDKS